MNQKLFVFVITTLVFSLFSCNSTKEKEVKNQTVPAEGAYNAEMKAIDSEIENSGQTASSLRFTKENGSTIVVRAHLSDKGNMLKIEEEYNDGELKNIGTTSFYYKKDKIFATREYFDDKLSENTPKFVDRISYYDEKGNVIRTVEKRVNFEEELENAEYTEVKKVKVSIERAKKVLDQKDEYKITFQGIIEVNALNYLIVGSSGNDAFTSGIRVDYDDAFIKTLLKNQEKYLNKKIEVVFENITDQTGFTYQSYIQGKFLE
jgi:hypothetical protein